jgi:hypothetical protein
MWWVPETRLIFFRDDGNVVVRRRQAEAFSAATPRRSAHGTIDERVSTLEARVDEHARGLNDLRLTVLQLEDRMERRFDGVDRRFLAMDQKLDAQFLALDGKISRLMNLQVGILTAVVTVVGGLAIALVVRI